MRARVALPTLAALPAILAALSFAEPAQAFEHQHHFGLGGGLSLFNAADAPHLGVGAGLAVHYAYGMTDAFTLMVETNASAFSFGSVTSDPKAPRTVPSSMFGAAAGVAYVIDEIQWVPYVGALAGAEIGRGGNLDSTLLLPDVQIAAGCDYMLSRSWAVGLAYRQHLFVTKMDAYPSLSTVFLRAEYVWGW